MAAGQVEVPDLVAVGIERIDDVPRAEGDADGGRVVEPGQRVERAVERQAVNGAAGQGSASGERLP